MEFQGLPTAVTLDSITVLECEASDESSGYVLHIRCPQDDKRLLICGLQ